MIVSAWDPVPHRNSRKVPFFEPDIILIHDTASPTASSAISWMKNPDSKVSYHYLIDRNGRITQHVDVAHRAWHAGVCRLNGEKTDMNSRSIGIGLVNTGSQEYPPEQIAALVGLVEHLMRENAIPVERIVGHRDVAWPPGRKSDPCDLFPWESFRGALETALGEAP